MNARRAAGTSASPDAPQPRCSRRAFLVTVAAAATCIAGRGSRLAAVAGPLPPSQPGRVEYLHEPLVLGPGEVLENRHFAIAEDFRWNRQTNAAIFVEAPKVTLRNVRLRGSAHWLERWNRYHELAGDPPGFASTLAGIRLRSPRELRVEDVEIEGFPRAAIMGSGVRDAHFQNIRISHCFAGLQFQPFETNERIHIEDVQVRDTWGPAHDSWPNIGGPPSAKRPGGHIGGNGINLSLARNATVRNCSTLGEQHSSFKFVNPRNLLLSGLRGSTLNVVGHSRIGDPGRFPESARDVRIVDCAFDKSWGEGEPARVGNCVTVASGVKNVTLERCTLSGAGRDGHGIVFVLGAQGQVTGCRIGGFNGTRGGRADPAYAIRVASGCKINDDVESVNEFVDQERILRRG